MSGLDEDKRNQVRVLPIEDLMRRLVGIRVDRIILVVVTVFQPGSIVKNVVVVEADRGHLVRILQAIFASDNQEVSHQNTTIQHMRNHHPLH